MPNFVQKICFLCRSGYFCASYEFAQKLNGLFDVKLRRDYTCVRERCSFRNSSGSYYSRCHSFYGVGRECVTSA